MHHVDPAAGRAGPRNYMDGVSIALTSSLTIPSVLASLRKSSGVLHLARKELY
jgi:hypothetical protein